MWECYYCGSMNKYTLWHCDRCNAPRREPVFIGTPGYDLGFDIPISGRPYFIKGDISVRDDWDILMSDNVARSHTEPDGAYMEVSRVTNYKSSRSAYLRLVDWIKERTSIEET
jgi:hypothetical protein